MSERPISRLSLGARRVDVPLSGLHTYIQDRLQSTEKLNYVVKLTEFVSNQSKRRQTTPARVPTPTYLALITHLHTAPPTRALLLLHQMSQKVVFRAFLALDPRLSVKFSLDSERDFSVEVGGITYVFGIDEASTCSAARFGLVEDESPPPPPLLGLRPSSASSGASSVVHSQSESMGSGSVMWTIVSSLAQIVRELEVLDRQGVSANLNFHQRSTTSSSSFSSTEPPESEGESGEMSASSTSSSSTTPGSDVTPGEGDVAPGAGAGGGAAGGVNIPEDPSHSTSESLASIRGATSVVEGERGASREEALESLFSWISKYLDPKKWDEVMIVDLAKKGGASTSSAEAAAQVASGVASPTGKTFENPLQKSGADKSGHGGAGAGGGGADRDRPWAQKKNLSMREQWIQSRMKTREAEYTELEKVRVVIGTWNADEKFPPPEDLMGWLHLKDGIDPDIVAVGLQEVDMSAGALLLEQTTALELWDRIFQRIVELADGQYTIVGSRQLVGLYLVVLIKREYLDQQIVSDVMLQSVGCGALGSMGNKGGIALRFMFRESSMCFINSHLAAGHSAVKKRHHDMAFLENHIDFGGEPSAYSNKVHDVVFWFGDLNYRIDLPYEEVVEKVHAGQLEYLMQFDQLRIEKGARNVFVGYDEAPIMFKPTYRFDKGTDTYDTSEQRRIPAWCDRIQWRKKSNRVGGGTIHPLLYDAYFDIKPSDHKPVGAIFEVGVKKVVEEKFRRLYQEYIKKLDKVENDLRPELRSVPALGEGVEFRDVKYGIHQEREITFRNIGQVICEFRFVPKRPGDPICKSWLRVTPNRGMIIPEESVQIKFTALVDRKSTPQLNETLRLDDILILRLKNGGDHFVSLTGNYLPSCFGSSISTLVGLQKGIRELNPECPPEKKLLIPKEIWNIVEYLRENALREPGLFLENGTDEEVHAVKEMLDLGQDLHTNFQGSNHSMAQALISLLKSFEEPVVPTKFHQLSVFMGNAPQRTVASIYSEFLMRLPPEHFNVLQYICAFLRELLKEENVIGSELSAERLAVIFSKVVFRPRMETGRESEDQEKGKINFLRKFLDYQQEWNDPATALLVRDVE